MNSERRTRQESAREGKLEWICPMLEVVEISTTAVGLVPDGSFESQFPVLPAS